MMFGLTLDPLFRSSGARGLWTRAVDRSGPAPEVRAEGPASLGGGGRLERPA